jgi:hypothetical protein
MGWPRGLQPGPALCMLHPGDRRFCTGRLSFLRAAFGPRAGPGLPMREVVVQYAAVWDGGVMMCGYCDWFPWVGCVQMETGSVSPALMLAGVVATVRYYQLVGHVCHLRFEEGECACPPVL